MQIYGIYYSRLFIIIHNFISLKISEFIKFELVVQNILEITLRLKNLFTYLYLTHSIPLILRKEKENQIIKNVD